MTKLRGRSSALPLPADHCRWRGSALTCGFAAGETVGAEAGTGMTGARAVVDGGMD